MFKLKIGYLIPIILIGNAFYINFIDFYGPDLVWNMILSAVAYYFILVANAIRHQTIVFARVLVVCWFFFYPNTFYMLTDIVHMEFVGNILADSSCLALYFAFISSILFGVFCGIESVKEFLKFYPLYCGKGRIFFFVVLSLLSSFAIHIGRYARLNSWDIVSNPLLVVKELIDVLPQNGLQFVLGYTILQFWILVFSTAENG